jgi:hypothetical protein
MIFWPNPYLVHHSFRTFFETAFCCAFFRGVDVFCRIEVINMESTRQTNPHAFRLRLTAAGAESDSERAVKSLSSWSYIN